MTFLDRMALMHEIGRAENCITELRDLLGLLDNYECGRYDYTKGEIHFLLRAMIGKVADFEDEAKTLREILGAIDEKNRRK